MTKLNAAALHRRFIVSEDDSSSSVKPSTAITTKQLHPPENSWTFWFDNKLNRSKPRGAAPCVRSTLLVRSRSSGVSRGIVLGACLGHPKPQGRP